MGLSQKSDITWHPLIARKEKHTEVFPGRLAPLLFWVLLPLTASSQWVHTSAPADARALKPWGPDLIAGTSAGVYRSADNGDTWTALNNGLPNALVCDLALTRKAWYTATPADGLYRSTNDGTSWEATSIPYRFIHVLGANDTTLFVGTSLGGVYRTTDDGNTWDNLGLTNLELRCIAVKDTMTFVGSDFAGVHRSTDGGAQWTAVNSGLRALFVNALLVYGDSMFASDDGIFLSANEGDSWTYRALSQNTIISFAAYEKKVFAGAWGGNSLFLSTDNGTTWNLDDYGFPVYICRTLLVKDGYLFAGTDNGVWRRPVSEFPSASEEPPAAVPTTVRLVQNYPNPFNPSTTIEYQLPERVHVVLAVFTMLGQKAATLVDEVVEAGYRSVRFDASGLPSGVYLCRLQAGGFVETKRMTVLK